MRKAIGTCFPFVGMLTSAVSFAGASCREMSCNCRLTIASGGSALRCRYVTVPVMAGGVFSLWDQEDDPGMTAEILTTKIQACQEHLGSPVKPQTPPAA